MMHSVYCPVDIWQESWTPGCAFLLELFSFSARVSLQTHAVREGDCLGFLARCVILIRQLLVICPKCCKTVQESWKIVERGPSCSDSGFVYRAEFCRGFVWFGNSPQHHCPVEVVWQTDCDSCDQVQYTLDFNVIWQIQKYTIRFQLFIFSCILNDSEGILLLAGTIYIKNKCPLYFIQSQLCRI